MPKMLASKLVLYFPNLLRGQDGVVDEFEGTVTVILK
jgi:hypothetical protein